MVQTEHQHPALLTRQWAKSSAVTLRQSGEPGFGRAQRHGCQCSAGQGGGAASLHAALRLDSSSSSACCRSAWVRPACSAASVSLGQLVCEGGGGANLTDLVEYIRPLQYFLFISGVFGVGGKHTLGNKCYRGTMMESPPVDPVRRERQHLMLKLDLKNQNTSKPVLRPLK